MELKVLNDQGQSAGTVAAVDTVFGRDFNEPLVHQVVVAYQANARSANRAQKDRSEVRHSTKKPWRQKGTGRARAGMTSSPMWRGGGKIFPNKPDENFSHKVNKKMYRAGMCSILSQLAREDRLAVVDSHHGGRTQDQAPRDALARHGAGLLDADPDRHAGRKPAPGLRATCPTCWCWKLGMRTRCRWCTTARS